MTRVCVAIALLLISCGKKEPTVDDVAPATPTPIASAPAPAPSKDDQAIKTFWAWFSQFAAERHSDDDLEAMMAKINSELQEVSPEVFAYLDDRTLVLSAGGKKALFPLVERIHAARPQVPGWTIVAFRQREVPFAIEMNGKTLDPAAMKFVSIPRDDKLDVTVYMPAIADREQDERLGSMLLDHAVGEYDMEMKIGAVEFEPIGNAPKDARPFSELAAAVDATK